jgi:hypothetical protein
LVAGQYTGVSLGRYCFYYTLHCPEHLILWISIGILAVWVFHGSEKEIEEFPPELVYHCSVVMPVPLALSLWRSYRGLFGLSDCGCPSEGIAYSYFCFGFWRGFFLVPQESRNDAFSPAISGL